MAQIHLMAVRRFDKFILLACTVLLAGPTTLRAADIDGRAENLRYDPADGTWTELPPPVPGTPEGDYQIARSTHAQGHHDAAYRKVKSWIKTYGQDNELYPEVALLRARIRIAKRDFYKAHTELQDFMSQYAGTPYADDAIKMEFIIAERFLNGTRRKFAGIRFLKADDIGLHILDDISDNHPGTEVAELALLTKAEYYFRTGDHAFAEHEYARLIQEFPRSRYVRKAMYQSALAAMASFAGIEFDDAALIEAQERFTQYLNQYPGAAEQEGVGQFLTDISETRATKEYEVGRYYERTHHPGAAEFYYRSTVRTWPDSIAALKAEDRLRFMGFPVEEAAESDDAAARAGDADGAARLAGAGESDLVVVADLGKPDNDRPSARSDDEYELQPNAPGGDDLVAEDQRP